MIQFGVDPLAVHDYFRGLGCHTVDYLFPDFTHDSIAPIRDRFGPTPCADFLVPIFDDWWGRSHAVINVTILENICKIVLGGESQTDNLGNGPFRFAFVETDGAIEGLDVLRVCKERLPSTGLNVLHDDIRKVAEVCAMRRAEMFDGVPLPTACGGCPERDTCSGGYLPHRYSTAAGFNNPSVWCADLLKLFTHVRERLGVSVTETSLRRDLLREMMRGQRPGRSELATERI